MISNTCLLTKKLRKKSVLLFSRVAAHTSGGSGPLQGFFKLSSWPFQFFIMPFNLSVAADTLLVKCIFKIANRHRSIIQRFFVFHRWGQLIMAFRCGTALHRRMTVPLVMAGLAGVAEMPWMRESHRWSFGCNTDRRRKHEPAHRNVNSIHIQRTVLSLLRELC